MNNPVLNLLGACIICTAFACASMKVESKFDGSFDYGRFKTFAWHPKMDEYASSLNIDVHLERFVRNSIEHELKRKGFKSADHKNCDFLILYNSLTETGAYSAKGTGFESYPIPWDWDMRFGRLTDNEFGDGTLVIDFVERKSMAPFWRGNAVAQMHRNQGFDKSVKIVDRAVRKILREFPPRS